MAENEVEKDIDNYKDNIKEWLTISDDADKKRLESAKKRELTPKEISDDGVGIFVGSSGNYNTTLLSCECVDFARRKRPCKHIFRLAIELGIIEEQAVSDARFHRVHKSNNCLSVEDAKEIISSFPIETIQYLRDIMYEMLYHRKRKVVGCIVSEEIESLKNCNVISYVDDKLSALDPIGRNEMIRRLKQHSITSYVGKAKSSETLAFWIVENVKNFDAIFPDVVAVRLSDCYEGIARKLYSHIVSIVGSDYIFLG